MMLLSLSTIPIFFISLPLLCHKTKKILHTWLAVQFLIFLIFLKKIDFWRNDANFFYPNLLIFDFHPSFSTPPFYVTKLKIMHTGLAGQFLIFVVIFFLKIDYKRKLCYIFFIQTTLFLISLPLFMS